MGWPKSGDQKCTCETQISCGWKTKRGGRKKAIIKKKTRGREKKKIAIITKTKAESRKLSK